MTRPPCRDTDGTHRCCRLHGHPLPHLDPAGIQWDEHGVRQNRGNDPWKGEVA